MFIFIEFDFDEQVTLLASLGQSLGAWPGKLVGWVWKCIGSIKSLMSLMSLVFEIGNGNNEWSPEF